MTSAGGLPSTPPQRPPLSRGRKELVAALAALPVLLVAGIYLGGRISDSDGGTLAPAAGIASPLVTELASPAAPLATVKPATPKPVVTVKPATPGPVVTVKPATPGPVVTVKPATPRPVFQPPAPQPVVTVKPPAPSPVATVRPHGPTTAPPLSFPPGPPPPSAQPPALGPVAPTTPPAGPAAAVLGRGSAGADVRAWQEQMARRGWRIRVDGVFGPQTQRVARRFQHNKGLLVDGLVGRQTWAAAWRLPVIR